LTPSHHHTITHHFNSLGQLASQVDPDGITNLFQYDDQGRRIVTAIDLEDKGIVDYAGLDQITLTTNDVTTDNGANVNRTRVFVWSTNTYLSNLVSTAETSVEGLTNWSTTWNGTAAVTTKSVTVYSNGTNRTVTITAPDGSYSVSAYQFGQLLSTTRYDANHNQIGATTNGYDQFGRQNTVTDARNGTTTSTFNSMDQVSGITTPAPTNGQSPEVTSNYFDLMGRMVRTKLPDSTYVTNVYNLMGLVATNCGSRTYPVAYGYDAQGRMTTMTTWTNFNFSSGTGAETTTWNYDIYRGFLSNKVYSGSAAGPWYIYTPAGRLSGRTWARGVVTTNTYNAAGALATVRYSDGTPGVTNGYDRRGRLVAINNGPTVTSLTLNDAGELLSESYSGGPLNGISITNGFDSLLRRPNNTVLNSGTPLLRYTSSFDAASRLLTVSDGTNSATYSYHIFVPCQFAAGEADCLRQQRHDANDGQQDV
jgi:YD repeat-containing protein